MILRALTLAGGLAGATATSQFPEFSQQYIQRLGGAVDALSEVVADFDASAAAEGLTRTAALSQMQGTAFLERRRSDMTRSFARLDTLRADLAEVQDHGPFMRAYNLPRLTDRDIAQAAWAAYQPALPLNFAGAIFAGIGFVLGGLGVKLILRLFALLFRRKQRI
ncbi:DUF2937 domain-containing protein [Sulfitobacter sp. SK012]|uniref:DUF2937 family protein n=1 Tax=Sulfitobacter sp. SK012 TaxID=1389005 RepID=UPI000E0C0C4B|nr:DUF2937 family protein [Sulfitobacter sp. SK012]AXI48949.1 DUF2937 domain-containing protein [Sulfitobacter sp. SK012]